MYFTTQDLLELKPSNSCENQLGLAKTFLDATLFFYGFQNKDTDAD